MGNDAVSNPVSGKPKLTMSEVSKGITNPAVKKCVAAIFQAADSFFTKFKY